MLSIKQQKFLIKLASENTINYKKCKDVYYNNSSFHRSCKVLVDKGILIKRNKEGKVYYSLSIEGGLLAEGLKSFSKEILK